jgi:protein-disulfide isomerase
MKTVVSGIARVLVLATALSLLPHLGAEAAAAQDAGQNAGPTEQDRLIQELVREISRRVVEDLRNGDFLREQIRLGIEAYVRDQEAAQAAVRAEQARLANERVKDVRPASRQRDHIYGSPDAPISLIEYSDFECPFCKRFHTTPKDLVDAYPGEVNWVYRHLPLPMHAPGAQRQAEAAECAAELGGNDAFWAYADAIYARTESNGTGFALVDLVPLAVEVGLDEKPFQTCLSSERHAERVREDVAEASRLGVNSTPTVIVRQNRTGAVRLRSGALPMDVFAADIVAMGAAAPQ